MNKEMGERLTVSEGNEKKKEKRLILGRGENRKGNSDVIGRMTKR